MAALCVTCGLLIRTARDFSMRAASTLVSRLLERWPFRLLLAALFIVLFSFACVLCCVHAQFPALGRQQLSQQAQQVIDTCLGPRRASDYADLRTVTRYDRTALTTIRCVRSPFHCVHAVD